MTVVARPMPVEQPVIKTIRGLPSAPALRLVAAACELTASTVYQRFRTRAVGNIKGGGGGGRAE